MSERAIVQLYTHQHWDSASRPVLELKGFQRISLEAGEKKTVRFHLAPKSISFWSPQSKAWGTEASTYDVRVGDSSAAELHSQFEVGAVATYVPVAIVRKELKLDASLYTCLQILSVSIFEKPEISCALPPYLRGTHHATFSNQPNLFDI